MWLHLHAIHLKSKREGGIRMFVSNHLSASGHEKVFVFDHCYFKKCLIIAANATSKLFLVLDAEHFLERNTKKSCAFYMLQCFHGVNFLWTMSFRFE